MVVDEVIKVTDLPENTSPANDDVVMLINVTLDRNEKVKISNLSPGGGNPFDQDLNTTDSPTFAGLTVDTNTIFVDTVNSRLGVGTLTPLQAIQVGDSGATNQYLAFQTDNNSERGILYYLADGSTIRGFIKWDSNEDLIIKGDEVKISTQNKSSAVTIDADGNMGIDNTSPDVELDVNGSLKIINIKRFETAGEALTAGDVVYLNSDGKYWKADASAEATSDTELLIANATISADATGEFIELGEYTTTGLTAGAVYYLSETAGSITATAPTTSLSIVRVVGYAKSTTELIFKPDITWIEVA